MMKEPAFQEKMVKGPIAVIMVRKPGLPNMGSFLGCWFLYLLFVSFTVAFVCGQTLRAGTPYLTVSRSRASWRRGLFVRADPERDLVGPPLEERLQGSRRRRRLRSAHRRHIRVALAEVGVSLNCPRWNH
jgi:hypothetical protein